MYNPEPNIEEMLAVGRGDGLTTLQEAFDEYTRNAELFFDMNRYSEQYAKFVSDIAKKGWTCLFGDVS